MKYVVGIIVGFIALAVAWVFWRWTSVARGARQRDEKIMQVLDPLVDQLRAGRHPSAREVEELANTSFTRLFLYDILKHFERLDLFPRHLTTREAQAEAQLAYWMMHPNEYGEAPDKIELVEKLRREVDRRECEFLVFRFQMAEGHWAARHGWMIGLAGPYFQGDVPYSGAGAFSRSDKYGEVQPADLVDWFMGIIAAKSG